MNTIDTPAPLHFKNGNNFPGNFVMMGYGGLAVSLALVATGNYIFGAVLLLISLFPVTNRHHVVIAPQKGTVHDYTLTFGLLKIGKKHPLKRFHYVTAMPMIQSHNVYASTTNSHTVTESSFGITLFGDRLRGKLTLAKYDSKSEAKLTAQQLADRLSLTYFDYDPKLVRRVLLGEVTL